MTGYFKLTMAVAAASVAEAQRTNWSLYKNFDFSGMQMLDKVIAVSAHAGELDNILDHGCWCAKLDPLSDMTMLGGATPVDELDDICRRWAIMRHCNDALYGGSCFRLTGTFKYGIDTNDSGSICQHVWTDDPDAIPVVNNTVEPCAHDSCIIDEHFVDLILDYLDTNAWSSLKVDDYDTCLLPEMMDMTKTCSGNVPNLVMVNTNDYKTHSGVGYQDSGKYAPNARPWQRANKKVGTMGAYG